MSRILRALVVSALATSAAIVVSAVVENRDDLSLAKLKKSLSGLKDQANGASQSISPINRPAPSTNPLDSLSGQEEEMLLSELEGHV